MDVKEVEVSDPTDWLDTSLSSLFALDSALRCQVCKEFYDTPMITSCSHTFCSLCIRRCLSSDGKCPTCRSDDQSSKLRRNWAMQECVDAFSKSRQTMLDLAKNSRQVDDHPKRKRRKLSNFNSSPHASETLPARRTRSSARIEGRESVPASQDVIALDSEEEEDIYVPGHDEQVPEPNDGLVACPMCNRRMKEEAVFAHLDHCNGQQVKENTPTYVPHPRQPARPSQQRVNSPAKHLPHLNYSLLKDTALRKKLQELGIPSWGNRQLLIRRHTQWVDIFNANSDSPRPRSNRELLRDLDVWERTQGGHAPGQGQSGPAPVMRKDFDGNEWTGKHKSQFEDLVAQARAKRKTAPSASATEINTVKGVDTMEGSTTIPDSPSQVASDGIGKANDELPPKIDTSVSASNISEAISSSPVASMLHSAAQDVRRRTSISGGSTTASGLISMHSIPNVSATSASIMGMTHSPSGTWKSQRADSDATREREPSISQSETSLPEKLGLQAKNLKQVPMFEVPANPVNDVEGLGSGEGDG
ncbi:DNA repair protein rad18 [Verruconis gallopava]|uniref:Postreplication repair E3 ubiquitin-protein ligase RAD18 n=1 Tax=Verruconis gallopava TaxID=253628 RepID=A0A0D2A274_9PEZI|nr:DNA repair protein rad18 [Verruconis gallopava]KIW00425.1 DNA repair protein rad18 [Verruconis gallopava]